jgi:hypothetical protein
MYEQWRLWAGKLDSSGNPGSWMRLREEGMGMAARHARPDLYGE